MPKPKGRPNGRLLFADGFEALRAHKSPPLSKKFIAEEAGVSPQFLADLLAYRAGASPDVQKRIAQALGVPIEALFPEITGWAGPFPDRTATRSPRRGPRVPVAA